MRAIADSNGQTGLARERRCVDQIQARWPAFLTGRQAHLRSHGIGQTPSEKVAENILCDLFTRVLDWPVDQVRLQEHHTDMLLTRLGVKHVIVEAKRPGSLDGPGSISRALNQARGYAEELNVDKIAVSDGCVLEAHDLAGPGSPPRPRLRVHLSDAAAPAALWWLSTRGVYRTPRVAPDVVVVPVACDEDLLHPKYKLPARCFAYVGDPRRTASWKLPYLRADGSVDERRLPKAIQSVLQDYRGEQVRLPEDRIPEILIRLADAAARLGRMPHQDPTPAAIYLDLEQKLGQISLGKAALGQLP